MTDKIQKIREEVERLRNLHQMKYQQLDTNDNMCLVECGKRNLCNELLSFIDSLQEEPVSCLDNGNMPIERWKQAVEAASNQKNYRSSKRLTETCDDYFVDGVQWADEHPKENPVSEELEDAADKYSNDYNNYFDVIVTEYDGTEHMVDDKMFVKDAFKAGAKWQKAHNWKPADGDDLPEIDREVIALEGIIDTTANDCFCGYKVVFAHRPTKEGYEGKSIATGLVEHYTPKTYGEGGWNIPNIVYWLDIELPKEIEL